MESPTHSLMPCCTLCVTQCVCTLSERMDKGYQDSFLFIKASNGHEIMSSGKNALSIFERMEKPYEKPWCSMIFIYIILSNYLFFCLFYL